MSRNCLIVLILAAGGCGGDEFPLAAVSGTVTLDGAPAADARVGFSPQRQGDSPNAGPGSFGQTDPQGRFRLTTILGDDGAVIGPHVVSIRTLEDEGASLQFTVTADGTDEANFKLTSNGIVRNTAGDAVGDAAGAVGDAAGAVGDAAGAVGDAAGAVGDAAGEAVEQAREATGFAMEDAADAAMDAPADVSDAATEASDIAEKVRQDTLEDLRYLRSIDRQKRQ